MKKNQYFLTKIICLLAGFLVFAGPAATQNKYSPKKITIEGIPSDYNGMYGVTMLFIDDGTNNYNTVAWSKPVLIKKGSVTNVLQVSAESGRINKPFYKDGEYRIYLTIKSKSDKDQDLPPWQGNTLNIIITKETTVVQWSDFEEVFG